MPCLAEQSQSLILSSVTSCTSRHRPLSTAKDASLPKVEQSPGLSAPGARATEEVWAPTGFELKAPTSICITFFKISVSFIFISVSNCSHSVVFLRSNLTASFCISSTQVRGRLGFLIKMGIIHFCPVQVTVSPSPGGGRTPVRSTWDPSKKDREDSCVTSLNLQGNSSDAFIHPLCWMRLCQLVTGGTPEKMALQCVLGRRPCHAQTCHFGT